MRDVIELLRLRLLILRRTILETNWKDRIRMSFFVLLFLFFAWDGVGSLMSRLYSDLDANIFVRVPWWIIIIVGTMILLEGLRSTVRILYNNPDDELLLSLPIKLEYVFLERWFEKLLLNVLFMLICVLALFQYSRFAPVPWAYTLISINVLLVIQQIQCICAIIYSTNVNRGLKNGLFLIFSCGVVALTVSFLYFIIPQSMSSSDLYKSGFLSVALLLITFPLQQLFVSSFNREYKAVRKIQFSTVRSFHKLFVSKIPVGIDQKVKSLIVKDVILFLRQFPVLQCVLSFMAIVILSFIMNAQESKNTIVIFSVFGFFVVFVWTLYLFDFDRKQTGQMWILKVNPLSNKQIWKSKFIFVVLVVGISCSLFLIPALISSFDLVVTGLSIGLLVIQALLLSSLAVSILFTTYPFLKAGEYLFVILVTVFYSLVLVFPPLFVLFIPILLMNRRKSLTRIEQLEL